MCSPTFNRYFLSVEAQNWNERDFKTKEIGMTMNVEVTFARGAVTSQQFVQQNNGSGRSALPVVTL